MAVLFALFLLSPVAAFAFSNAPAHCLELGEAPQVASQARSHHHGTGDYAAMAHEHMDHGTQTTDSTDSAVPAKCCGLFCVTALTPPAFGVSDMRRIATTEVALPVTASLLGRAVDGIDRPPRSLLSL
ncbi:hypothetical protein DW352_17805 [Pseudolabrys taiwanensis]|uniref:DUF2946 domain-containing protein n=1 Tax=Pseudolabrys taiwanensis TaxID=331696 RepID=A0A345ZZ72_9HYPH|nr:hypothetical protein [Pseudolabrys taiwanensis]AXK82219.1 hypothetical protein DW352_17805 [Pseudolabrys taiwanensis]